MAAAAGTILPGHGVVIEIYIQPIGNTQVARITRGGSGNVIRTFTPGDDIVMAVFTRGGGLIMGKGDNQRQPAERGMTGFAYSAGQWVIRCFTRTQYAVVTAGTGLIADGAVVEVHRRGDGKSLRGVAGITRCISGNMRGRFTQRQHAVMADLALRG